MRTSESKGHQQLYDSSAAFEPEVRKRTCGMMGANFGFAALGCREHFARPRQILGCIDAERHVINDAYVDAHARFERAQLFQFFALLQGGRPQADEARERGTAVCIKPEVIIARALARG